MATLPLPLTQVAGESSGGIVRLFLDMGHVNLKIESNQGPIPLMLVAANGDPEIVESFLNLPDIVASSADVGGLTALS